MILLLFPGTVFCWLHLYIACTMSFCIYTFCLNGRPSATRTSLCLVLSHNVGKPYDSASYSLMSLTSCVPACIPCTRQEPLCTCGTCSMSVCRKVQSLRNQIVALGDMYSYHSGIGIQRQTNSAMSSFPLAKRPSSWV